MTWLRRLYDRWGINKNSNRNILFSLPDRRNIVIDKYWSLVWLCFLRFKFIVFSFFVLFSISTIRHMSLAQGTKMNWRCFMVTGMWMTNCALKTFPEKALACGLSHEQVSIVDHWHNWSQLWRVSLETKIYQYRHSIGTSPSSRVSWINFRSKARLHSLRLTWGLIRWYSIYRLSSHSTTTISPEIHDTHRRFLGIDKTDIGFLCWYC